MRVSNNPNVRQQGKCRKHHRRATQQNAADRKTRPGALTEAAGHAGRAPGHPLRLPPADNVQPEAAGQTHANVTLPFTLDVGFSYFQIVLFPSSSPSPATGTNLGYSFLSLAPKFEAVIN